MRAIRLAIFTVGLISILGCQTQQTQTPSVPLARHQQSYIGAKARLPNDLAIPAHIVVEPGDNTTQQDKNDLVTIIQHLNAVESDSCFSDFMTQRGPTLIEKEVNDVNQKVGTGTPKTTDEIISDLTQKQVTSVLDIWHPSWADYVFRGAAKACAFENGDGHVHAKAACYYGSTPKEKGVTIEHELAHDLGYAHYTKGNQEAGNEMTVPYSTQYAIRACWDKVPMQ